MSVSLNTAGAIKFQSSGTGANSYSVTLNAPTAVTADRTVSIVDPGANANLMLAVNGQSLAGKNPVIPLTAAATRALTVAESGSVVTIDGTNAVKVTLPAIAGSEGVNYLFLLKVSTPAADVPISALTACLNGVALGAATAVTIPDKTTINFTNSKGLKGDRISVFSDGVNWNVIASGQQAGAFTVA